MFLAAAGFDIFPEKYCNEGRMDLVLHWKKERVYVLELKISLAQEALRQIKGQNYAGQFVNQETVLVGLRVDLDKKSVVEWLVEKG
jgi:hypothetical protein